MGIEKSVIEDIWWLEENEIEARNKKLREIYDEIEFLFEETEFYLSKCESKGFLKLVESFNANKLNNWLVVLQQNIYHEYDSDEFKSLILNCMLILQKLLKFDIDVRKDVILVSLPLMASLETELNQNADYLRELPLEFDLYVSHYRKLFKIELLKRYYNEKDLSNFLKVMKPDIDIFLEYSKVLGDFLNVFSHIRDILFNKYATQGSLQLTVQQINPYPLVFKDYSAYIFFRNLFDTAKFNKECGDISFVFRKMKEDGLIVSPKTSGFRDWVNIYFDRKISIIKYLKDIKTEARNRIYINEFNSFF